MESVQSPLLVLKLEFLFSPICVRLPENYRQAFFLADRDASVELEPLLTERSERITSTVSFQEFWQFLCCITRWLKATVSGTFRTWASDQRKSVRPYAWTSLIAAVWSQFHRNRWLSGLGHESLIHKCTQRNQTYCMRGVCAVIFSEKESGQTGENKSARNTCGGSCPRIRR